MAAYRPVKQSASKEEFLKVLELDGNRSEDRWKFAQMWEEVTAYWVKNFETTNREILKEEYKHNMAIHRPFKWAHLSKATIDQAIGHIWENGRPWPRNYYDIGQSNDPTVNNWVIKWLLWHVCRYRDWRNRKGRSADSSPTVAYASSSREMAVLPERDYWQTIMN